MVEPGPRQGSTASDRGECGGQSGIGTSGCMCGTVRWSGGRKCCTATLCPAMSSQPRRSAYRLWTRCGRRRRPRPRWRVTPSRRWQQCWPPVYRLHRHCSRFSRISRISSLSSCLSACKCAWHKCHEERDPARPTTAENAAPMAATVEAASAASSASSRSPPTGPPHPPCCVRAATGRTGRPPARAPGPAATAPPGSSAGWR